MNDTQQIEVSMEKAKSMISMANKFDDMRKTKAFTEIIEEGYFTEESKRLTFLLSDANMQDEVSQKQIHDGLVGIGQLFQYFRTLKQLGVQAENSLAADQDTHAELLAEGVSD